MHQNARCVAVAWRARQVHTSALPSRALRLLPPSRALAESVLVEAPLGECLSLPPKLPHAPAVTAQAAAALPRVDLWCVDNSLATFMAATPAAPHMGRCHDLRSPLGLTPAALLSTGAAKLQAGEAAQRPSSAASTVSRPGSAASAAEGPQLGPVQTSLKLELSSAELYQRFHASSKQQRTEEVSRILTPAGAPQRAPAGARRAAVACRLHRPGQLPLVSGIPMACPAPAVVDFLRVWWWDGDGTLGGEGISIWRPVAPPGYAALGDCLMRGYDPPTSACVVQDTGTSPSRSALGQAPCGQRGAVLRVRAQRA